MDGNNGERTSKTQVFLFSGVLDSVPFRFMYGVAHRTFLVLLVLSLEPTSFPV